MTLILGMLAPRLQNEGQQILVQLQAASPHYPQAGIFLEALAGDPRLPLIVETHFRLDDDELSRLNGMKRDLATNLLQAQFANQRAQVDLVPLLATPQGQQMLAEAEKQIDAALPKVQADRICELRLELHPGRGFVASSNFIGAMIISTLERNLPFNLALFSFFPADRALPPGEVNIQLGGPDAAQLLASHSVTPQTKYSRLKQTIVNSHVAPYPGAIDIRGMFNRIFEKLLVGRALEPIKVSPVGQINIPVRDLRSNRVFDIDSLSSGEKGLILTLLLMATGVAKNGNIIIDEPELHLNPALCRTLLPFLIEECLLPFGRQAIICSHSPEVLASAFDDSRCKLFNLVGPRMAAPIISGDRDELFAALSALGAGLDDILFSRGTVYVEGPDDERILRQAAGEKLFRLRIVEMRGRGPLEAEIKKVQNLDRAGKVTTAHYFVFDLDRRPTDLQETEHVKLLQWDRHCIENYLLDANAIYDVLQDEEVRGSAKPENRAEIPDLIKQFVAQQIKEIAISAAYDEYKFESPGVRQKELRNKIKSDVIRALQERISGIQEQVRNIDFDSWAVELEKKSASLEEQLTQQWSAVGAIAKGRVETFFIVAFCDCGWPTT